MTKYRRILVPIDGSDTANQALAAALDLAGQSGGRVRLMHAVDELAFVTSFEHGGGDYANAREAAERIVADAAAVAKAAGVPAETLLADKPAQRLGETVAREAASWEADLIVVGTHGRRGLARLLLGSGAEQIVRLAPVPVLVIRGREHA